MDKLIKSIMDKRQIPGLQLAIVKNGEIIKLGNYGLSNLQDNVPVRSNTVFPINSMTKAFTGVALLQLAEQGRLSLDDEIGKHLTDLPANWKSIKIKHLMAHTSGLPNIFSGYLADLVVRGNPDAAWNKVKELPLKSEVNTQFSYNQTGYVIIGKIIDKYVQGGFPKFIIDNQLKIANMKLTADAGFEHMTRPISNHARQYLYDSDKGQHKNNYVEFPYILQSAAGMNSTATEIAQYLIALQSKKLLKNLHSLWTPITLKNGQTAGFNHVENGYAIGWQVIDREHHRAVSASGGNAATMIHYPEDKLSIVVLTNLIGGLPIQFVDKIAAEYIPEFKL
ncbi:beta-lactamase family protein [Microbulbifer variabilis]|uniref:Beta-lactamase family protein n=1 Tax=Microbulbifer variabilis TaxID=266805 RepID=A0ABY4VDQ6_9GAMM|nr:serine hydrolase domain-containing protein [Microbulbifer variabilis]USD21000.1 beta-lactamase family protein [Microbulbifer variabilis]